MTVLGRYFEIFLLNFSKKDFIYINYSNYNINIINILQNNFFWINIF
jgi:hypothetical protein